MLNQFLQQSYISEIELMFACLFFKILDELELSEKWR